MTITKDKNKEVLLKMYELLGELKNLKSQTDKSEVARFYAITITLMEQVLAYFKNFIVDGIYFPTDYEK